MKLSELMRKGAELTQPLKGDYINIINDDRKSVQEACAIGCCYVAVNPHIVEEWNVSTEDNRIFDELVEHGFDQHAHTLFDIDHDDDWAEISLFGSNVARINDEHSREAAIRFVEWWEETGNQDVETFLATVI